MRKWTRQPPAGTPLDRINPLTHGLVFAANMLGPRIETYPSNKLVEAIGISTLPTTSGTFANLDTNTDYISFANDSIPDFVANGQDFSVLLYCQDGTLVSGNQRILSRTEDATNVDGFSIIENGDTGNLRWTVRKTDVQTQINSNNGLSKTEPTVLIGTAEYISGTSWTCAFWHGPKKSTTTAATAIGVGDNDTFFIGKRRDTSDNPWVGAAGLLVVWDRVLADAEATALIQNPWQIFKRRQFALADVPDDVRFLPVEKPWTRQPPAGTSIDWGNPLTQDLKFLFAGSHTGGPYGRDLVSGAFAQLSTGETKDSGVQATDRGMAIDAPNDDTNHDRIYVNTNFAVPNSSYFSIFAVARCDDTGGTWHGLVTLFDNDSTLTDGTTVCELIPHGTSSIYWCWDGQANTEFSGNPAGAAGNGNWYSHGFTNLANGSFNTPSLYINGVDQGSPSSGTHQTTNNNIRRIDLGGTSVYPSESWGGPVLFLAVFVGAELSAREHESLHQNPWQIFKPQIIHAPADVALPDLATFERDW